MKSPLLHHLLVFPLLVLSASAQDPWASQTGLTRTQLDTRLAAFAAPGLGVVPEQITGYEDNGELRYTALWGPRTDTFPRQVLVGLPAIDLSLNHANLHANGWRLHHINGYHTGGADYYNAIYRRTHGPAQTLRLGQTLSEHNTSHAEQTAAGRYLENLTVFRSAGISILYAAFWNQPVSFAPQTEVSYTLTRPLLNAEIAARSVSNWRIHSLCGNSTAAISGDPNRYTVIWRRPAFPAAWRVLTGMDKANHAAAHANHTGIGWRPAHLQAWKHGGDAKLNSLWLPNGGLDPQRINAIDTLVENFRAANSLPALSLAVSRGGRLVFNRAYGLADPEIDEWAGANHRFRFASVAKPITGAAVVHALEKQTARNLDSPVFGTGELFGTTYGTPPYDVREHAITIRHLLHHTSGWLSDGRLWRHDWPDYGSDPKPVIDWQLDNIPVAFPPGDDGRYSNLGYVIAARAVERLSGKTYETYVTDHLFTPSGATSVYRPRIGGRTKAERQFMEVTYDQGLDSISPYVIDHHRMDGSTGWVMRPSDLLLLGRRLDGDPAHADLLSADSITALHTRGAPNQSTGYNWQTYGLGWATNNYTNPARWGHNGAMPGTRAEFHVETGTRTSFAWVANRNTYGDPNPTSIFTNDLRDIFTQINNANAWPDIDLFGVWHPEYNAWVEEHFTVVERAQPGLGPVLWHPAADPDGDGLPNAAEFYHGLNPRQSDPSPYHTAIVGGNFRIRWLRAAGVGGAASIDYTHSGNLANWISSTAFPGLPQPEYPLITAPRGYIWQQLIFPKSTLYPTRRFIRFHYDIR